MSDAGTDLEYRLVELVQSSCGVAGVVSRLYIACAKRKAKAKRLHKAYWQRQMDRLKICYKSLE